MRLDHLLAKRLGISERSARESITSGTVSVDQEKVKNHLYRVSRFQRVEIESREIQKGMSRVYLMLHKPVGILSATSDPIHRTVIDLIDLPCADTLHLAGRLDRSSSGLILLTNDGAWSQALTEPEAKVEKEYIVKTDRPIPQTAVPQFAAGFRFEPEGILTQPAELELLDHCTAKVILREGRYHQIKRMFHRLDGIRLVSLHRSRIGAWVLPPDLEAGCWRAITP